MTSPHSDTAADGTVPASTQLSTDVVDTICGYQTIFEVIAEHGGRPSNVSSVMCAVHSTVAAARDWFGTLDEKVLEAIVDGGKRLIESYQSALNDVEHRTNIHRMICEQRDAIRVQVAALPK